MYKRQVKRILERCGGSVHGLVHNTGGGVTKCLRVGRNIRYVKDHLPDPDPVFLLIQREAGVEWREMFEDYNMGIGFEVIVDPESAEEVLSVADSFKLGAQVIGRCERGEGEKALIIRSRFGVFRYP